MLVPNRGGGRLNRAMWNPLNSLKRLFGMAPEQRAMTSASWGNCFPLAKLAYGQEREVLGIPSALCAVRVISDAFASCPVEIIETKGDERRVVKDHPLSYLLNIEANPEISATDFKTTAVHHFLLWGNSFSEIVRDNSGEVNSFRVMLPNYTQVMRNEQCELFYRTTLYPSMDYVNLDSDSCLHTKGISFDGYIGIAPVQMARTAFELAHSQEDYANNWFASNAKPGAKYTFPQKLSQQFRDNLIKSHEMEFAGSHNANRVAVIDQGGSFDLLTIPAEDGQWLASRGFQLGEIARIFNINPVFLMDMSSGWTSKNLETINTAFVQVTLVPILSKFEIELKRKCLGSRSNLSVHFNVSGLMRADHQTRLAIYSSGLQNGIYCINECRRWEGLPDIGPTGDEFRVQLNVAATGADGQPTPSNPSPNISEDEGEEEAEDRSRRDFKESDHPRKDNGEFGSGGGGKSEHHAKAEGKIHAEVDRAVDKAGLSPDKAKTYKAAVSKVVNNLSPKAAAVVHATVKKVDFHPSAESVTSELRKATGKEPSTPDSCKGFYSMSSGRMVLDGEVKRASGKVNAHENYAHEFGHALDNEHGKGNWHSDSDDFKAAYDAEIKGGKLSEYAKRNRQEGFAEFARTLYGTEHSLASIEKHFPMTSKVYKALGFWPDQKGG